MSSSDFDDDVSFSASPKKKVSQLLKPKGQSKVVKKKSKPESSPLSNFSSTASHNPKKTIEQIYQKKTQLEHILLRPDSYIGSTEAQTSNLWVYENDGMVYKSITYVPGFYKIFDEIIVNAADNKVRDPKMDTIKVSIDRENNTISVWNNGRGIPIEIHSKEKVYVPELIFGHLLTSSNYDDDEKKVTGGRNGYGAKLCNIFSTEFIVETCDAKTGKKFRQVYRNNMSDRSAPEIVQGSKKEEYTKITFKPDLARFHLESIDDDFEALLKKRVYDLAGCCHGVKVYLNDVRIKIKDFKEYIDLYLNSRSNNSNDSEFTSAANGKSTVIYDTDKNRWEIGFAVSDGQFQQVSFVNSICTIKGGTHVNFIADQVVSQLIEAVKKKDKKGAPVKPFQAKNHLWLFVNCSIENPTFDSQTKETMTLRASSFGSKFTVGEDFMKKVMKSGVVDNILKFVHFKENQMLKKTDGAKKTRISGIVKLGKIKNSLHKDDANNAGTRLGNHCTLILTEGDSAKSLAVSGLAVVGRDNFGVFPLRGKLLNVRDASPSMVSNNAEINSIKQILGLQHGKVYQATDSLRYGHLMIMTDQDHDGSHIKGLIINLLDHFWPSLMKIPGFLLEFITPIVKVSKGKGNNAVERSFFTIPEYENWKEENEDGKGWNIKYYKGLGTSTTADAKKYFSDMNKHLKPFSVCENEERGYVDMAFNKKKADDRKEWLRQFQPGTYMDHRTQEISIGDFINKELILFSMADNARSIPSVMDGFKPGQRKILFACFKRNLKSEIKVAQLAGYVSEHAAYHHGEQSLCSTIVGMAQTYVGSNNLNFLEPLGQFGTRLQGGKDAASARYIFTNLTPFSRLAFHPADDALLKTLNDDGQSIEPEWYLPIIPMVLVNGAEGIGTGWSTSIPNYNPRDIVENIHLYLGNEELKPIHPWYRGFTGKIEYIGKERYRVTGIINKINDTTVEITELPIRSWTQSYKEQLEEWLQGTEKVTAWIKDYKEYHTDSSVHFVITLTEANMAAAEKEGLEVKFKLVSQIATSNLVCFDREGRIRKYSSVNDILSEFCDARKEYYQKRKEHLLQQLTAELTRLENRVRFVTEIIEGKLIVQNRKKVDLIQDLKKRGYHPIYKSGSVEAEEGEKDTNNSSSGNNHGYDYLMSMPIWSLTMEKVQSLLAEKRGKEQEVKILIGQTINDLWRTDLDALLAQWDEFERIQSELESTRPGKSGPSKKLPLKKAKPKKNDDSDVSMEGEEDEFSISQKKKLVKAKSASLVAIKKESPKKASPKKKSLASSSAPVLNKSKHKPKPFLPNTASKGIDSYFSVDKPKVSSPVASLSESLSSMDVESKKKTREIESMQVSDDDIILSSTPKRRSPRAAKKKTIIISSESEAVDSESEPDFEESDFEEDE